MPAWLIPALKAILPHLGTIVTTAAPVFTKKSADAAANQAVLLQQQITELQTAAAANDALIKELAAQIQQVVTALEQAASIAERRHRQATVIGVVAVISGVSSLSLVLLVLLAR
jgi:hypothetical protein